MGVEKAPMSPGERQAASWLLRRMGRSNALVVVVSELAGEVGISVTTFLAAMRKLESAGALRRRSLGRMGTLVEVLDPALRRRLGP